MRLENKHLRERPFVKGVLTYCAVTGSAVYGVKMPKDIDYICLLDDGGLDFIRNQISAQSVKHNYWNKPHLSGWQVDGSLYEDEPAQEIYKHGEFVSLKRGSVNLILAEREFVDKWILAHNHLVDSPKAKKEDRIAVFEFYGIHQPKLTPEELAHYKKKMGGVAKSGKLKQLFDDAIDDLNGQDPFPF